MPAQNFAFERVNVDKIVPFMGILEAPFINGAVKIDNYILCTCIYINILHVYPRAARWPRSGHTLSIQIFCKNYGSVWRVPSTITVTNLGVIWLDSHNFLL